MTPRDEGRYAPASKVTLESLDERVENIERLLVSLAAHQTPKWLKAGGWVTIAGSFLGVALKTWLGGGQ